MDDNDQVTLGIGQGISAEELAASVHDCSIDELRAIRRADNVDQDVREARRWMGKLPRDQFDLLLLLMREREAAGRRQGLREAVAVVRQRVSEGYPTPPVKGDKCVHDKFGWEDCIACYDDAIEADLVAITALIEGEGK